MQRLILDNGMRVLLLPQEDTRVFTLDVWVQAGSRYENGYHGGISHLMEHMLFKGTERRTSRDISLAMDAVGGVMNAYTGQEATRYYIQTLGEYADAALDLLSDMLLHTTIPERELALERQVVLEEIAMYEDSAEDTAHDSLTEAVWKGSGLGAPISGTRESVLAIDREELLRFLRDKYTPDRMVMVCAGSFDPVAVEKQIRQDFGSCPTGTRPDIPDSPLFIPSIVSQKKAYEQVSLELGFPGLPSDSPERYALSLLTAVVGDGESSRLYQRLREELGLTYGIYAVHYACLGAGMYTVSASVSPKNQMQALEEIGKVLTQLVEEGITEEELVRAKARAKAALIMSQETVAARAAREGRSERLFGRSVKVQEVLEAWERITCADVLRLARQIFVNTPALSVVGPVEEEEAYRPVLEAAFPSARI